MIPINKIINSTASEQGLDIPILKLSYLFIKGLSNCVNGCADPKAKYVALEYVKS